MAAAQAVIAGIDQVIALFNQKKMDLPDHFFDRKTQFVINGAPFETLLGQSPTDPLILMLTRGPAGFRFTAKGLQHAIPDARVDREDVVDGADPLEVRTRLRLSGTLRGSGERINAAVGVTLTITPAGIVQTAAATIDEPTLEKIRQARRS